MSDVFAGNENIRYQVKTFVTHMRKLTLRNKGGVILTAHPSKSAMIDGSGYSGTTAWNGAVRNRLYLTTPRKAPDEDEAGPTDERVLRVMKSNYGPYGEKIKCKWTNGVFVESATSAHGTSILEKLDAKAKLYDAARYFTIKGSLLAADANAKNSLVVAARKLPSCRAMDWNDLRQAQDSLEREGRLLIVEVGPQSKRRRYVRPAGMSLPGEPSNPPSNGCQPPFQPPLEVVGSMEGVT